STKPMITKSWSDQLPIWAMAWHGGPWLVPRTMSPATTAGPSSGPSERSSSVTSTAVVLSYFYELLFLPAHAYQLYRLRVQSKKEAYTYIQETMSDLAVVSETYKQLKKAE